MFQIIANGYPGALVGEHAYNFKITLAVPARLIVLALVLLEIKQAD